MAPNSKAPKNFPPLNIPLNSSKKTEVWNAGKKLPKHPQKGEKKKKSFGSGEKKVPPL